MRRRRRPRRQALHDDDDHDGRADHDDGFATVGIKHRRLCVAVVAPGDRDGAWDAAQAIRLYHSEVADDMALVVVDCDPEDAASARDRVFRAATAELICCIDAYALLAPGALASTLAWFDEHPDSRELIEGPGWFACRRDAWPAISPFAFFAGIFCLNLDDATVRWSEATQRHAKLAIGGRVQRFAGVATPDNPHRGIALSYRRMIAEAQRRGYAHLLVLEDDAVFLDETVTVMRTVVAELAELEWDLCYLGACVWTQSFPFVGDSTVLQACGPVTCTHAVAFHARAYARLLADIPAAEHDLDRFLRDDIAIDQYLSRRIRDGTYRALITSPRVASQPNLLDFDDGDAALAARYVISGSA